MAEPARKVARQAEIRLDEVAATVREKFDRITASRFAGRPGRPVDRTPAAGGPQVRADPGTGTGRADPGLGRKAGRAGGKPR